MWVGDVLERESAVLLMFNSRYLLDIQVAVMRKQLKICVKFVRAFWTRHVNHEVLSIKIVLKVITLDEIIKEDRKDRTNKIKDGS